MYLPLTILTIFALLDVLTTYVGLSNGAYELNPIALYIWHKIGVMGLIMGKLILIGLISSFVRITPQEPLYIRFVWFAVGVQIVAVAINGMGLVTLFLI